MPHTLFPTAFGTCGVAWNDTGLTGFQLPEETETLTEPHLAAKARSLPATDPVPRTSTRKAISRSSAQAADNGRGR